MTNETTSSQPKSIGDDAQFLDLLRDHAYSYDPEHRYTDKEKIEIDRKLIAFIDNFRAPAAQASAAIQAAPEGYALVHVGVLDLAIKTLNKHGYSHFTKRHWGDLAATIQEPVMVAEPVSVVSVQELSDLVDRALALPKSLSTRSWELTPIQLGWIIGQVCRSQVAAPMVAEKACYCGGWDDVHQQGCPEEFAPMVADPLVKAAEQFERFFALTEKLDVAYIADSLRTSAGVPTKHDGFDPDRASMVADPAGVVIGYHVTHGEFRHFSGAVVPAQSTLQKHAPSSGYYKDCADLVVTPLVAATVKAVPSEALAKKLPSMKADPLACIALAVSGALPDAQAGEILRAAFAAPLADKTGGGK